MARRRAKLRIYWPSTKARTSFRVSRETAEALDSFRDQLLTMASLDAEVVDALGGCALTDDKCLHCALRLAEETLKKVITAYQREGK